MKTNLTSRSVLAVLVTGVLILTQPLVILAQQDPVEAQAKVTAESDAEADVNKVLWGFVGCSFCVAGVWTSNIAAIAISGILSEPTLEENVVAGCCGAGVFLSPLIPMNFISINPSPQRLLGKSPEYVNFYTRAYRAKTRRLRMESAAVGTGIGCGVLGILTIVSGLTRE